jgi:hypothetical protein
MGRPRDPVLKAAAVEITQTLINWALGIVATLGGGAIGWLARSFASLRDADSKLTDKVHDLAVLVAGMQQSQIDTMNFRKEMRDQLQYIISRLDKLQTEERAP